MVNIFHLLSQLSKDEIPTTTSPVVVQLSGLTDIHNDDYNACNLYGCDLIYRVSGERRCRDDGCLHRKDIENLIPNPLSESVILLIVL